MAQWDILRVHRCLQDNYSPTKISSYQIARHLTLLDFAHWALSLFDIWVNFHCMWCITVYTIHDFMAPIVSNMWWIHCESPPSKWRVAFPNLATIKVYQFSRFHSQTITHFTYIVLVWLCAILLFIRSHVQQPFKHTYTDIFYLDWHGMAVCNAHRPFLQWGWENL